MAGTIKKILKRTLGGLKMAAAWAPMVLGITGALGFIGPGIAYLATLPDYEGYKASPVYVKEVIQDLENHKEAYESGTISEEEYWEFVEYVGENANNEYTKEVLKRDIEGNEEWRGKVYNSANSPLGITSLACLGTGLLMGGLTLLWLGTDIHDDLQWSAENDFDWEPPIEEKPPKKNVEPETVEETTKIKDDISDDQENLGTTDDFLSSLQS